jgi:hypothetical protein
LEDRLDDRLHAQNDIQERQKGSRHTLPVRWSQNLWEDKKDFPVKGFLFEKQKELFSFCLSESGLVSSDD